LAERKYLCIDLKSFYASVECIERGLNPLTTNLVVADKSRTEKTICLAVTPSLKACGVSGRARLFEVVQKVKEINNQRRRNAPKKEFNSEAIDYLENVLENWPTFCEQHRPLVKAIEILLEEIKDE
jgi:DNA polymerase V